MILYEKVSEAVFLARPNRFIAQCQLPHGDIIEVHVANTGRCQELLIRGAQVILAWASPGSKRKTPATLVAVKRGGQWINIDSQAPNRLVWSELQEGLVFPGIAGPYQGLKKEVKFENSRIDFSFRDRHGVKTWLEVKGVTLKVGERALFPDAPTLRGKRHLDELGELAQENRAAVLFVIQMEGIKTFQPNYQTHPEFAQSLKKAMEQGLEVFAWQCQVFPQGLKFHQTQRNVSLDI
ncbi:MAG: DNA/RNA nuclease SfsA [Firmicutes bacterium]|nr:DNA/RNA nuclease SfsA [Bacillota bacterium]